MHLIGELFQEILERVARFVFLFLQRGAQFLLSAIVVVSLFLVLFSSFRPASRREAANEAKPKFLRLVPEKDSKKAGDFYWTESGGAIVDNFIAPPSNQAGFTITLSEGFVSSFKTTRSLTQ